uniref:Uncharacterized protein n=1 Tax=Oryza barthii TaxID=65489 RepID=A0A0D3H3S0_9ORYZ
MPAALPRGSALPALLILGPLRDSNRLLVARRELCKQLEHLAAVFESSSPLLGLLVPCSARSTVVSIDAGSTADTVEARYGHGWMDDRRLHRRRCSRTRSRPLGSGKKWEKEGAAAACHGWVAGKLPLLRARRHDSKKKWEK